MAAEGENRAPRSGGAGGTVGAVLGGTAGERTFTKPESVRTGRSVPKLQPLAHLPSRSRSATRLVPVSHQVTNSSPPLLTTGTALRPPVLSPAIEPSLIIAGRVQLAPP